METNYFIFSFILNSQQHYQSVKFWRDFHIWISLTSHSPLETESAHRAQIVVVFLFFLNFFDDHSKMSCQSKLRVIHCYGCTLSLQYYSVCWRATTLRIQHYGRFIQILSKTLKAFFPSKSAKIRFKYCMHAIITCSWFETAPDNKPRILDPKIEQFPCLVHKFSVTQTALQFELQ